LGVDVVAGRVRAAGESLNDVAVGSPNLAFKDGIEVEQIALRRAVQRVSSKTPVSMSTPAPPLSASLPAEREQYTR
jgi:hypothetical protein